MVTNFKRRNVHMHMDVLKMDFKCGLHLSYGSEHSLQHDIIILNVKIRKVLLGFVGLI